MRVQTGSRRRGLVGAVLALGVGLVSVLIGPATPAQAIPAPVGVSATSAVNAASPKFAVVACPAGLAVYGAGGTVNGGAGNVVMSDVIPTLGTVTVWGIEVAAFAANWSVTAYAICGPPTGNVVIANSTAANAASPKTVTAACPAGMRLYGTGYELQGANGQVFPSLVQPNAALTNVTVGAVAHGGFAGAWSLTAYGICAAPAGFMQLVTASSPANAAAPKGIVTPACPGATNVHGVGAAISGGLGDVLLETMAPSTGALIAGEAEADEYAPVGANWAVTSYAICSS
ncbi:hypothetical protein [Micromonospora sp. CPCC 206061]|uniref:hypothetical protein n=1 Tax=Micromonospora sp. CPCC 206061 TaxID=3122410 RepID=UPI002FF0BAA2